MSKALRYVEDALGELLETFADVIHRNSSTFDYNTESRWSARAAAGANVWPPAA